MANNNSFLPEDYLEKRITRRTNAICITLFAVVMVGVVGAFFVTNRQRSEVRDLQTQVNLQFEEAARRLEQLDELRSRKQQMIQKARITSVLVERVPRSLMMSELINHMPQTLSLLELDLETKVVRSQPRAKTAMEREAKRSRKDRKKDQQPPPIQVQSTEMILNMVGVAPTDDEVAEFMSALSSHELFYAVNLVFTEDATIQDHAARKFRLEMKVSQDMDLSQVEPTKVARELKQNPMADSIQIEGANKLVTPASHTQRP
jgi:uncharacterized protein YneF (UPF0154 family)